MAKKTGGRAAKTDYRALSRALRENGPQRLYMLWGEEDYLRERFFAEIKKVCLSGGGETFNYHRLSGVDFDVRAFSEAVDALPFLGGHSLVEVRDFDPAAVRGAKAQAGTKADTGRESRAHENTKDPAAVLTDILADIPESCTVVLLLPVGTEPDGRLALVKTIKKLGSAIEFTTQPESALIGWISQHFAALGKQIAPPACRRLILVSGSQMTRLLPEIEKIAAGTKGETVTETDIDRLAQHLPEADVFAMTDRLADRNYDAAAALLAELLASGENEIMLLALIGAQMRRLYVARVALEEKRGAEFVMQACNLKMSFIADKLLRSARGFTEPQLADAVALCAEYDYRLKSSGGDQRDILKELLLRLAAGAAA